MASNSADGSVPMERLIGLVAAVTAAAALGLAFALESLLDLQPCSLCLYQRWAYAAALVFGIAALTTRKGRAMAAFVVALVAVAFAVGGGVAFFHVGVEQQWWTLESCSGTLTNLDVSQLAQRLQNLRGPACDDVQWRLFGLFSLAEMNAVASFAFAALTAYALVWTRRRG